MKDDLRKSSGIEDTFRIIQPVKPVEEGSSKSLEHNISFQANVVEHALHPDVVSFFPFKNQDYCIFGTCTNQLGLISSPHCDQFYHATNCGTHLKNDRPMCV